LYFPPPAREAGRASSSSLYWYLHHFLEMKKIVLFILPYIPYSSTFVTVVRKKIGFSVRMHAMAAMKSDETSISPQKKRKTSVEQQSPSPSKRSPKKVTPKQIILASDILNISVENRWIDLQITPDELRCSSTLTNGQCFNWMVVMDDKADLKCTSSVSSLSSSAWGTHNETEWIGVVDNMVLSLRETPTTTFCRVLHAEDNDGTPNDIPHFLSSYFQMEVPLAPLYSSWAQCDNRLSKIAAVIPGVRIIRQNPVECLFSFICSSNNNIPRITKMLSSLRQRYGAKLIDIPIRLLYEDGTISERLDTPMTLHSFPTVEQLQSASEEELREMGFGYRAKYIIGSRDILLKKGGLEYLLSLRTRDCNDVQEELLEFSGIGRKVADCVALFSLDQSEAIPVDTHVKHIASRDFDPSVLGSAKSITPTVYKKVGDLFRDRFHSYAGWAHSLLFVAELPSFRNVLPSDVVAEMDLWKEEEKGRKAMMKEEKTLQSPSKDSVTVLCKSEE
jgi:N-glycosylase/DNA lyase